MTLDIDAALRDGFSRTFKRNGLLLMAVFLVFGLVSSVLVQTATAQLLETISDLPTTPPAAGPGQESNIDELAGGQSLALPIPLVIAAPLAVLTPFVGEAIRIIAVRTLVSDRTDTIPGEYASRNIVWATINGFIGGIVVWLIIIIGGIIGLIGILIGGPIVAAFLGTSFFFVRQEIAIENKNFVDAMTDSWQLSKGHRIGLFALALTIWLISLVASIPGLIAGFAVAAGPLAVAATTLVSVAVSAVTTVFGIAVAARAYDQLRTERAAEENGIDTDERRVTY